MKLASGFANRPENEIWLTAGRKRYLLKLFAGTGLRATGEPCVCVFVCEPAVVEQIQSKFFRVCRFKICCFRSDIQNVVTQLWIIIWERPGTETRNIFHDPKAEEGDWLSKWFGESLTFGRGLQNISANNSIFSVKPYYDGSGRVRVRERVRVCMCLRPSGSVSVSIRRDISVEMYTRVWLYVFWVNAMA